MSSKESKPVFALYPSYIAAIKNSVGTNMFRNLFYIIDNKPLDVLDDGDLACAWYVSGILHLFGLISETHTWVKNTLSDMEHSGWYAIAEPKKGAIVYWDYRRKEDGTFSANRHIGFYIDSETAISNDWVSKTIALHHLTFGTSGGQPQRAILAYYWHPRLDANTTPS